MLTIRNRSFLLLLLVHGSIIASAQRFELELHLEQNDSDKVYLSTREKNGFVLRDSVAPGVRSASFEFSLLEPSLLLMRYRNKAVRTILSIGKTVASWKVTGGELTVKGEDDLQEVYDAYESRIGKYYTRRAYEVSLGADRRRFSDDTLRKMQQALFDSAMTETRNFIRSYPHSFYSLSLLEYQHRNWPYDTVASLYRQLGQRLKHYSSAKEVEKFLSQKRDNFDFSGFRYYRNPLNKGEGQKYYLIDFWGSWCAPCVAAIPKLKALQKLYENNGLQLIGIAYEKGDDLTALDSLLQKHTPNWPQIVMSQKDQKDRQLMELYAIGIFPTYLLLDGGYNIVMRENDLNKIVAILQDKLNETRGSKPNRR